MRTPWSLLALFALAHPLVAQSVAGKWNGSMDTPGGTVPLGITLVVHGDTLTGTVDDNGVMPLTGMVRHDTVGFSYVVEYNGHPLTLSVLARVHGDSMAGLVDFNGEGSGPFRASRPTAPGAGDGVAVVRRMHDAYAGKWFNTLTFTQRTIRTHGAVTDTAIWYESLKGPRLLRIDTGDPAAGNGVLYTVDSVTVLRNGTVAVRRADGNEALPFVMGIYLQPVDSSVRQLRSFGVDLGRTARGGFNGMPVLIVGASDPADTTSPQFWVDPARLVAVRLRGTFGGGAPIDITLGDYQRIGGGWLATRVDIRVPGLHQVEEYYDWNTSRSLPDALFDPAQWRTAPHWAHPSH